MSFVPVRCAINVVTKWFIRARLGTEMVKRTNQMDYYLAPNVT
jgi:hypothetical protein